MNINDYELIINGKTVAEAYINNIIVYQSNKNSIRYENGNIICNITNPGLYSLNYGYNNKPLDNYEPITSIYVTENNKIIYDSFNELNTSPIEATQILLCNYNNVVVSKMNIPNQLKLISGNKLYSVGLLSDIHIDGQGGHDYDSGDSKSDFRRALTKFTNDNVDFVIVAGDVTYYGYDNDYNEFNNIKSEFTLPIYTIRGNHECYLNGSDNYDYTNNSYITKVGELNYEIVKNNDVYLFIGMNEENSSTPFSDEQLSWLESKVNEYSNKRIFLIVHYYYGDTGNVNHIVSIHSPINQERFVNIITNNKDLIYMSGHTHLNLNTQIYGKYNNIKAKDTYCNRIHIPSCAKPRYSTTGIEGSAIVDGEGSEGYLMEVYDTGIYLRGFNFKSGKYIPIGTYFLKEGVK